MSFLSQLQGETIQPNIIIFYVDDLGWQDTELNQVDDSTPLPWKTPHLKALAAEGINFQQGYSPAPTCAPSRVALLTGKHPARTGKTHVVGGNPPAPVGKHSRLVSPYWPGRMNESEHTLAEALAEAGYRTGHVGKWHCAINHNAPPGPKEQGFQFSNTDLGVTRSMGTNKLDGFATTQPKDKYRLQETLDDSYGDYAGRDARPLDGTTEAGLEFIRNTETDQPFFLFLAHWLVHTPIQIRDQALLQYYCQKMGYDFDGTRTPEDSSDDLAQFMNKKGEFSIPGDNKGDAQSNPFYAAMVDTLDWSLGKTVAFLKETDDPRNPGHKLFDTTYLFFTSDNGGMEGHPGNHITDNAPLRRGKISAYEGGVRVPLVVTGPGIQPGKVSQELVNGLDFYPTCLAIAQAAGKPSQNQFLDGLNLLPFLSNENTHVLQANGEPRDTLFWHFPNSHESSHQSSIRKGDFKLYKNYLTQDYSLYQLYKEGKRVDWEEKDNLIANPTHQAISKELTTELEAFLAEMGAEPSYWNASATKAIKGQAQVPKILSKHYQPKTQQLSATYETENKTPLKKAHLYYTLNGGHKYEEWFQMAAQVQTDAEGNATGKITAQVPAGSTHYVINLIDENNFLRSSADFTLKDPYSTKAKSLK